MVAFGATWKTSVFWFSLMARPFSVITGRRMIWYAALHTGNLRRFFIALLAPPLVRRFFAASSTSGLCCRFDTEPFNETCNFSIAGCEKITRSYFNRW